MNLAEKISWCGGVLVENQHGEMIVILSPNLRKILLRKEAIYPVADIEADILAYFRSVGPDEEAQ